MKYLKGKVNFIIFFIVLHNFLHAQIVNHKEELETFWRILFKEYQFGYTLFGQKPLSFERYYLSPTENILALKDKKFFLKKLWLLWEKERVQLSDKHFVMKKVCFKDNNAHLLEEFYLINKVEALKVIKKFWKEFHLAFEEVEYPEQLLELICEKGPHLIKNHRLLGLLLGYEDHNTRLFQQQSILFDQLAALIYFQNKETLKDLSIDERLSLLYSRKIIFIYPFESWKTLSIRYKQISDQLSYLKNLVFYNELLPFPLLNYRIDPYHLETKNTLEVCLKTQQVLKETYYNPLFLEIILQKLQE